MIDTHCHLTFPDFADARATMDAAEAAGVVGAITISTTSVDAPRALAVAKADPRVWCSAGVHPLYSDQGPHDWALLRIVASDGRCVAWGELGLDNHHGHPPKAVQLAVLSEQLSFIDRCRREGLDKPIVLHCREAFGELIPILRGAGVDGSRCVFHCFTGGPEEARLALDFGGMLSFTGVVTYRNARMVQEAARLTPSDRIMVETDAPFLSPEPKRGHRPCEPAFAALTARFLAALRGEAWEDFHRAIDANTTRFFGIDAAGLGSPGAPGAARERAT